MFFKNTGNATNATFVEMMGADNLFNAIDVGAAAAPIFVDVDRDGDQVDPLVLPETKSHTDDTSNTSIYSISLNIEF